MWDEELTEAAAASIAESTDRKRCKGDGLNPCAGVLARGPNLKEQGQGPPAPQITAAEVATT